MNSAEAQDFRVSNQFYACNDEKCSSKFKYSDWVVHSKVDGPDPRDHFANERNLLSWLRTGLTLSLIGFMIVLDLRSKNFAPSRSLPWSNEPAPYKTMIVGYIFVALGFCSILLSMAIYFKNQRRILRRLLDVGMGWPGYSMALLIMMFVCFVMVVALTELQ